MALQPCAQPQTSDYLSAPPSICPHFHLAQLNWVLPCIFPPIPAVKWVFVSIGMLCTQSACSAICWDHSGYGNSAFKVFLHSVPDWSGPRGGRLRGS